MEHLAFAGSRSTANSEQQTDRGKVMEGQMSKKNDDEKLDKYLDMFSLSRQPRGEREAGHGDKLST